MPFPADQDSEGGVEYENRDTGPYVTEEFFEEFILPDILKLVTDPIVNVRLCAARCIRNVLQMTQSTNWSTDGEWIHQLVKIIVI